MTVLRRLLVVIVVLLVLAGVVVVVGEILARRQIEATVEQVVDRELARVAEGDEPFASVETAVDGWGLLALARGRLEAVRVDARQGTVQGLPVRSLELRAGGVTLDGSSAQRLEAVVTADAAGVVASQLDDDQLAEAVVSSGVAVPPDRLRADLPFDVPLLGAVTVEVEVLLRVADGGLVAEPVTARVAGLDVDLAQLDLSQLGLEQADLLGSYGIAADELPAGLRADAVAVEDDDGTAVVRVDLSCASDCPLQL